MPALAPNVGNVRWNLAFHWFRSALKRRKRLRPAKWNPLRCESYATFLQFFQKYPGAGYTANQKLADGWVNEDACGWGGSEDGPTPAAVPAIRHRPTDASDIASSFAHADDLARPPLAHVERSTQVSASLSLGSRRHHFFASRSFSAALSSMASANSFFGLAFSLSRPLRRFASETSSPPYLAFQL